MIAGKLLARKRPHLIPVYDQVIRCLLGRPEKVWLKQHDQLAADDGALRQELRSLRSPADVPGHVSLLRVLDVVLWMSHRTKHRARDSTERGSVAI